MGFSSELDGHETGMHGKASSDSPVHVPPFLAGITTALLLFLKESPQVAEHFPQSLHTDHKQSAGSTDTIMDDSVVVNGISFVVTLSLSKQFLSSGPKIKLGGQVHM